ncbi:MAG: acyl-ACP--UDP-N-acetylglucosamine O-acyltransferase [Candidatus Omnitrophica bacterium]|nr:acyl-ACP--UDP-N-acetylglucosamine O-acyltransferase [Candidatus Omnitrophota bacterium]
MIHPTAIVDAQVEMDSSVEIGPYAVLEGKIRMGRGTRIQPHAHLLGPLTLGMDNILGTGTVIGQAPQHLARQKSKGGVVIGDRNVFREYATVHRSIEDHQSTVIGNDNFLMGFSHVGHDCVLGNRNVIANGALLAGHGAVADQVFISGYAVVHQFVRVGRLSVIGGLSRVLQDVPPFMLLKGDGEIYSLNLAGLKRAEIPLPVRAQLKQAFKTLFYSGRSLPAGLGLLEKIPQPSKELTELIHFLNNSKRGFCWAHDRRGQRRDGEETSDFGETALDSP